MIAVCLFAPLVLGALWGAWRGPRARFSASVLLTAPFVWGILITSLLFAVAITDYTLISPVPPKNANSPWWWIGLVGWGIIFFLWGVVPAILGSAAGQFVKLSVVRCFSRFP